MEPDEDSLRLDWIRRLERDVRAIVRDLYQHLDDELEAALPLAIQVAEIRAARLPRSVLPSLAPTVDRHALLVRRECLVALAALRRDAVLAALRQAGQARMQAVAAAVDGLVTPRPASRAWLEPLTWTVARALAEQGLPRNRAVADLALSRLACLLHEQHGGRATAQLDPVALQPGRLTRLI